MLVQKCSPLNLNLDLYIYLHRNFNYSRSHPDELLIGDLAASQGSMSNSVRRKGELGVKEDIDEFLKER